jgi:L-alanine-DL-glutamate epimerase-like enolase superfamily enzyme
LHGLIDRGVRIERLTARPLSVALIEPFVIATGRVDATRAVEIDVVVAAPTPRGGGRAGTHGLGEAACLPPITREDQPDVLESLESASRQLAAGRALGDVLASLGPVARAGLEVAIGDALSRAEGVPLRTWLGGPAGPATLETDVTIAIASPDRMGELARAWVARGFRSLKVKVGKDPDADVRALEAIGRAAPGAALRVDANAGYTARQAIDVARACERLGLRVECWEQPCAAQDLDGMAAVAEALDAPVIADESAQSPEDVDVIARRRCADGVNLKLAKAGGLERCVAMGRRARAAGLRVMVGGMVETRLGMTAAAHVACAVGGADFVDLDTAWLLADDPYVGGYAADGPRYTLADRPGLDVARR